jgi:hypothetical protein|tara:strand:+ start:4329 stop:4880 length:552 start_codon:yes stop_codon:yes gene_type:complete
MAFNINEIRSQLTLGGARPALFQVIMNNPVNAAGDAKLPFMAKAAQIPASTIGTIEVPYFGRKIKIAGDRTFAEWTVTIVNDEDFLIRNSMEEWMQSINSHLGNVRKFGAASPLLYKQNAQVVQYSKTGLPVRQYTFNGMWPIEVSTIDLAWESTDAIEEFTVTFQYDFWEVDGGITGNAGGN